MKKKKVIHKLPPHIGRPDLLQGDGSDKVVGTVDIRDGKVPFMDIDGPGCEAVWPPEGPREKKTTKHL
jgi:hypothetical protein